MNLTEEQLKEVEQAAYMLLSPTMIAISLEVDDNEFWTELLTRGTPIFKAYYKGYLRQLSELRASIIKSAQNGSNPAQQEMLKFLERIEREIAYE